ncbi:ATP-binding protein [Thalassovita mangrovi]|uniref:AAA family ATPase n=1 Tax=Thalassovita mangrovi TaxID=2692236 RepID=A0A6L8LT26_9RHOB|nr:ATP-binding protein [Thalassovita mangrovi]MYM56612.1 AAA family ATPase [Thalassovita mangrovi]
MSNPFVNQSVVDLNKDLGRQQYPLARAEELQTSFALVFSRHLGCLQSGRRFEARSMLVTGLSGSGKSTEIEGMLKRFKECEVPLPSGVPADFAECLLASKGSWKDLGKKTLHAIGYPLSDTTRKTQFEIWDLVVRQAKLKGIVGIHYDEAQHIMRDKSDKEVLAILDAFKTLMKSHEWPLMLILSGVPELDSYVQREPQLDRLLSRVTFAEIDLCSAPGQLAPDYTVLHEIVGSYAMSAGLEVDPGLQTGDFLHRLATAGGFRWGIVIDIVVDAVAHAVGRMGGFLTPEDFVAAWVNKTKMNELATPFTHEAYERVFRNQTLFRSKIGS